MTGLRILVVDDDPDFAETIGDILESRGHEIHLAHSGEDALAQAAGALFDLFLMDIQLPGINGVEVFHELRKGNPNARAILMTGYSVEQLIEKAVEEGAIAVLRKPVDIPQVLEMMDEVRPEKRVLLVDDDPDFSETFQRVLESHGYIVEAESNGGAAIERVRSEEVGALMLDIRLPDMNGLEVYLEARKVDPDVPVIVVTGFPREEVEKIVLFENSWNTGVMVKPIDPDILCRTVESMMNRNRSRANV